MTESRTAARLVLLDSDDRILLFRYVSDEGRSFWATPGGGLEAGESLEQAAEREAFEELGASHVNLRQLWSGYAEFRIGPRLIKQTETFFLLGCDNFTVGSDVDQAHRTEGIQEVRWWSAEEIESADAVIFPDDLVTRVRDTLPRST